MCDNFLSIFAKQVKLVLLYYSLAIACRLGVHLSYYPRTHIDHYPYQGSHCSWFELTGVFTVSTFFCIKGN